MRRKTGRAAGMAAMGEALKTWRRANGGRGRPIPEALWREATELARTNGLPASLAALLRSCLDGDPAKRPAVVSILELLVDLEVAPPADG